MTATIRRSSSTGTSAGARELDAAEITDPVLRAAYSRCRALNAEHGRTYFLATRLLAPGQRPAVHALYGFARFVDDLVDEPGPAVPVTQVRAQIDDAERHLTDGLATGRTVHPVVAAVVHTARRYDIETDLFAAFFRSMRMDLEVREYPTRADLGTYVHGSARVIGLQMLPVLGTVVDRAEAAPRAAALGEAFQLTNFLRDIAEDLDRDRVYLPADELAAFVTQLAQDWSARKGAVVVVSQGKEDLDQVHGARGGAGARGVHLASGGGNPWTRPGPHVHRSGEP